MHGDAAAALLGATTESSPSIDAGSGAPAVVDLPMATGADATARAADDHRTLLKRGLADHQAGRFDAARTAYEAALAIDPHDPDALYLYGTLLHQTDDAGRGIQLLRRAIAIKPNNPLYQVNLARALFQSGDTAAARVACDAALAMKPDLAAARTLRTELLLHQENSDTALQAALDAVRDNPGSIEPVLHLVSLQQQRGDADGILKVLDAAIGLNPAAVQLWQMRGRFLLAWDQRAAARAAYARAAALAPGDAVSRLMLARIDLLDGAFARARTLVDDALAIDPTQWSTATELAQKLRLNGYSDTALDLLMLIRERCPDIAEVEGELGIALWFDGNLNQAERHIARSLELKPDNPVALSALGSVLSRQGRSGEAVAMLEKALKLSPGNSRTQYELINALDQNLKTDKASLWSRHLLLGKQANVKEFFACCMTTLLVTCDHELMGEFGNVLDNLEASPREIQHAGFLASLTYADTDSEIRQLMRIHREWGDVQAHRTRVAPMPAILHDKTRRKIRIGLLSSDLRGHSVVKFVSPLIDRYDRDRVELYCYSPYIGAVDEVEKNIVHFVDSYQRIGEMSAREIIQRIRDDHVDIILELNGLTRHSRLPSLVDRAAPVQMEWLGYPFTTGLEQMDYLVCDQYLKPANPDYLYETPFEMKGAWVCFGVTCAAPIQDMPAFARRGHITFGSFNNMYKFSPKTLDLWAAVLQRVPESTFLVCRPGVNSIVFQSNFSKEMSRRGVDPKRLEFLDSHPSDIRYDECYNLIDISLDTAPLTGGTTTVDSLDMGVPVVSLMGPALHQRISYAVLNHVGCPDLVAETPEDYVEKAVALANNTDRLLGYRYSLRKMVRRSILCDWDCFYTGFQDMIDRLVDKHSLR